jgi:mono/diheme cytochrome c family protein
MSRIGHLCAAGAVVLGAASFATWPRDRAKPTSAVSSVEHGANLFQAKGCASCHTGPDTTALLGGFPSLKDAPAWAATRRPGLGADRYLAESMRAPAAFVSPAFTGSIGPTTGMPQLPLTDAEIVALVDYLLAA